MAAIASVALSSDPYTNALLGGYKWASGNLTYSFPTSSAAYNSPYYQNEPATMLALSATQKDAVRAAFANYAAVANVTFTELTGGDAANATLRLAMSGAPYTALAYFPNTIDEGGDAWFNKWDYNNPIKGNYAYATFIHEIGHSLGLEHPHQNGMPSDRDSMEYSVMTYRSYIGASTSGYTNETWGFAQSLMMYDIAAVQQMYGANFSTNNGNTTYSWSPTTGEMTVNGVGQGAAGGNRIFQTVWDGGGNDTYDFSNYATNLNVDLQPGAWTTTSTTQLAWLHYSGSQLAEGNIANALQHNGDALSLIENAIGGSGSDVITGNDLANRLNGGIGNDTLIGGAGGDTLRGGAGNDLLDGGSGLDFADYADVSTAMRVLLYAPSHNTGAAAGDTYASIEGLLLGSGNDAAYGGTGNNSIFGNGGHDTLYGGLGADHLDGGAGFDYARFDDASYAGLVASLLDSSINTGAAAGDTYRNIEGLILTRNADTGHGDSAANYLYGMAGDDTLYGHGGNDHIIGGVGNDTLFGGAGSDTLSGDIGDDRYTGGADRDCFIFRLGDDVITDFQGGAGVYDQIDLRGIVSSFAECLAASQQVGSDLLFTFNDHTLTLENFYRGNFAADDILI